MIDIEKFICSLLADHPEGVAVRGDIHRALKEQGLEYKDGKIVPIEDKTELKESRDERIRKSIIGFLITISSLKDGKTVSNKDFDTKAILEWIAWLEKQGNETPCDRCKKSQPSHSCQDITELGRCYLEHEKQGEQKPSEWSKEDELHIRELESLVKQEWAKAERENDRDKIHKMSDLSFFLKTLKPQLKQEWSEEDENGLGDALWAIKQARTVAKDENDMGTLWYAERWLKSIKDRIQSKQSSKPQGKTALEAIEEEKVDKPFDYENANIVQKDFAPKFEFGDWIVQENIGVYQVIQVCESWYEAVDNKGKGYSIGFDKEHMLRHWTINDAKPGDIIYAESKFNTFDFIAIFSEIKNKNSWEYCSVDSDSDDYSDDLDHWEFDDHKGFVALDRYNFYPATKKQRHLLYQKMKDAGYEWDAEKKKLIKIE